MYKTPLYRLVVHACILAAVFIFAATLVASCALISSNPSDGSDQYPYGQENPKPESDNLDNKESEKAGDTEPAIPSEVFLDVSIIVQMPELPTGCEATSVAMLLNYAGIEITKITVANTMPYSYDDAYFGYVGNPYTYWGTTIYPEAFEAMLISYLKSYENMTGVSFEQLKSKLIEGKPVVVWLAEEYGDTTNAPTDWYYLGAWYGFNGSSPFAYWDDYWEAWFLDESDTSTWRNFIHCVCLVGYDESAVYINDPLTGECLAIDQQTFIAFWDSFGNKALSY